MELGDVEAQVGVEDLEAAGGPVLGAGGGVLEGPGLPGAGGAGGQADELLDGGLGEAVAQEEERALAERLTEHVGEGLGDAGGEPGGVAPGGGGALGKEGRVAVEDAPTEPDDDGGVGEAAQVLGALNDGEALLGGDVEEAALVLAVALGVEEVEGLARGLEGEAEAGASSWTDMPSRRPARSVSMRWYWPVGNQSGLMPRPSSFLRRASKASAVPGASTMA